MRSTPDRMLGYSGHIFPKFMELIPEEGTDGLKVVAPTKQALEEMELQHENAKPPTGRRNI
jgi:hypothetical protein